MPKQFERTITADQRHEIFLAALSNMANEDLGSFRMRSFPIYENGVSQDPVTGNSMEAPIGSVTDFSISGETPIEQLPFEIVWEEIITPERSQAGLHGDIILRSPKRTVGLRTLDELYTPSLRSALTEHELHVLAKVSTSFFAR